MQLTDFTDYSLRVLLYLGLKRDRATITEIAQRYSISKNHLVKVVHRLSQLGFIETFQGPAGGMQLAQDPKTVRLGSFVTQMEPNMNLVECFNRAENTCPIMGVCRLEGLLYEARKNFIDTLDQHTLADLLNAKNPERLKRLGLTEQKGR